ncbi:MAG: hypothetical protein HY885_17815 [Deltaproteobacteria bacterium]|nr:hypothetical protein [Deltaproteobacteria bacterium]
MFLPGMAFGDREKWWAPGETRSSPHEGVDLYCYRAADGKDHFLRAGMKVPHLISGKVIAICRDFLGNSVFVMGADGLFGSLLAVYGHIAARDICGDMVYKGDEAGVIASSTGAVPSHLHLSLLKIPAEFSVENLDWKYLNKCHGNLYLNPF